MDTEIEGLIMKKYRHTHRSAFLFLLLTPLTLFIYPIVVLTHIGQEVNRMNEGKEGYRRSMNFVGVFFLGFITIGIVPLVWTCRVSRKLGEKGTELGIAKPHTSAISWFLLCFLFAELIVTFIIGLCKFLHTANAVERKLNELMETAAQDEAKAEIIAPEEKAALPAPKDEAKPDSDSSDQPVQENVQAEDNAAPKQAESEEVAEVEEKTEAPRRWRVRVPGPRPTVKVFDSREEAFAYANGVAAKMRSRIRVKK